MLTGYNLIPTLIYTHEHTNTQWPKWAIVPEGHKKNDGYFFVFIKIVWISWIRIRWRLRQNESMWSRGPGPLWRSIRGTPADCLFRSGVFRSPKLGVHHAAPRTRFILLIRGPRKGVRRIRRSCRSWNQNEHS